MRFHHVGLNCKDPDVTEAFYSRHFGFERARVLDLGDSQIVFIKSGDAYLELFKAEGDIIEPKIESDGPKHQGVRHLAFDVEDVDAKLAEMGSDARITLGPLDFGDFIPGWRGVWIADPDGNIVEISQGYKDEEKQAKPWLLK